MRVSYSPRALARITQAFDHIAQDNPAAADAFLLRVESITSDVQVIGLLLYRYLLFYKLLRERDEIRIVRVRHMSRRDAADVRGL